MINNKMKITFLSMSQNESFARSVAGMFALSLNPSIAQVSDIKTAVSEAVTNCIVHGYPDKVGEITMESEIAGDSIHINVFDDGVGIENVKDALEPFYTTKESEERAGMGFTIMETFSDKLKVSSKEGKGTSVFIEKSLKVK